jgi:hypothetical protein
MPRKYIFAKLGSHSLAKCWVKGNPKKIKVGDVIEVKPYPYGRYAKWQKMRVWRIAPEFHCLEYV